MTDKKFKVQMVDQFQINILFNYPNPFSEENILSKLTKKGFESIRTANISDILPIRSAQIARKDSVTINYIPEKGILGVSGNSFSDVSKMFIELNSLISEIMGADVVDGNIVKLYEIISKSRISSSKEGYEPKEAISNFIGKEKIKRFEKVVDNPSFFTIRIAPKTGRPNDVEWYDIIIEPLYINPMQYNISIIYRSQKFENIKKFVEDIENKIINTISLIEEG